MIGSAIGAYGKKPKIPQLNDLRPEAIQQQTIAGNQAAIPGLEALGNSVNQMTAEQTKRLLDFALPGQFGKASSNVSSMLSVEIPDDVSAAINRNAAARALAGGFAGSGLHGSLVARDLGLTSLDLEQRGLQGFQQLSSLFPRFDPTAMFFTPQQRLSFAFEDRNAHYQRDLLAAQVKAAPDPATAALGKEIDRFFNTWASFGMMSLGNFTNQQMGTPKAANPGGGGGLGGGGMYQPSSSGMSGLDWLDSFSNAGSANGGRI